MSGVLEVHDDGHGHLRVPQANYLPRREDTFVDRRLIREVGLANGCEVLGEAVPRTGGPATLIGVSRVNGDDPVRFRERVHFQDLTPISPHQQIVLETTPDRLTTRVIDLLTPIGRGQRCLIVAPPKTGKTTILHDIADAVTTNYPEIILIVLLVDERPEEVTDFRRNVRSEVVASNADEMATRHVRVAEVVLERAKRLVESGKDVVVLLDSITRLARAYNRETTGRGKTLTGGLDARAMESPRRFFGGARKIEEGGSLTVVGTALVDTGSRMDEVIFQEFKGTGNTELVLDRTLSDRRIFPAIDVTQSGTRREEMLYDPRWIPKVHMLRRVMAGMKPLDAMQKLIEQIQKFKTNEEFLETIHV
ncbi:MAG: transcription termination factor Rho [Planctomycetes bacterium]|nr:transcription termination factor Rho [Planctomycetota bacterium]